LSLSNQIGTKQSPDLFFLTRIKMFPEKYGKKGQNRNKINIYINNTVVTDNKEKNEKQKTEKYKKKANQ
jgi:hypothetical protein